MIEPGSGRLKMVFILQNLVGRIVEQPHPFVSARKWNTQQTEGE
jgi:hypothetical protein